MREPPPTYQPLIQEDGKASMPWLLHFNQQFLGDAGTSWTPAFTGLTEVGTATITGRYYKLSNYLVFFFIRIVPATSVSATAGTTYSNFPLTLRNDGACLLVGNNLSGGGGMCVQSTNRIYIPSLSAVNFPVTVVGLVEAS